VLLDLEADKADAIIIGVGESFEANVLLTATATEMGIGTVITRARSSRQKAILEKVGATRVLYPEQDAGRRLANSLVYGDAIEFVNLPENHSLRDLPLPARYVGKTLAELGLRRAQGLMVIAVTRQARPGATREVVPVPDGGFRLEAGDVLSVIASNEAFTKLS
jgi:trk system potassium uptake protein TrkA